jgi:hypothetical protein
MSIAQGYLFEKCHVHRFRLNLILCSNVSGECERGYNGLQVERQVPVLDAEATAGASHGQRMQRAARWPPGVWDHLGTGTSLPFFFPIWSCWLWSYRPTDVNKSASWSICFSRTRARLDQWWRSLGVALSRCKCLTALRGLTWTTWTLSSWKVSVYREENALCFVFKDFHFVQRTLIEESNELNRRNRITCVLLEIRNVNCEVMKEIAKVQKITSPLTRYFSFYLILLRMVRERRGPRRFRRMQGSTAASCPAMIEQQLCSRIFLHAVTTDALNWARRSAIIQCVGVKLRAY